MTYTVIDSRIESQDTDELTAIVTLRRSDGVQAEVWACAGIPEDRRGEVAQLTHGGTFGTSRGYEASWVPGDSPDCWCPDEFMDDPDWKWDVAGAAEAVALKLWRESNE